MSSIVAADYYEHFQAASQARSVEEIREEANKFVKKGIMNAMVYFAETNMGKYMPATAVTSVGQYYKIAAIKKKIDENDFRQIIASFLLVVGNFTNEKYWILLKDFEGKKFVYVSFPDFLQPGVKGKVQWAVADIMRDQIKAGKDSNLLKFLERANVRVKDDLRPAIFAKGYTLIKDNKEVALKVKEDVQEVIRSMTESRGKGQSVAPMNLKFITSKKQNSSII